MQSSIDKALGVTRHPLGKPRIISSKVSVVVDVLDEVRLDESLDEIAVDFH